MDTTENELCEPVELPRVLGCSLTGSDSGRPYTGAPLDLPPSKPRPRPGIDQYAEMVERHMLGDAEFTTSELAEIGTRMTVEFRRHIARLTLLSRDRDGD